jgi:hypothetical protein
VMAGSKAVNVQMKQGQVTVGAEGAALVQHGKEGVERVANVAEPQVVVVASGKQEEAKKGEEVIVADASLNEEELIPADGVERTPIDAGKIVVRGKLIQKQNVDVRKLLEKEKWLYINSDCFSTPLKIKLEKIRKQNQLATNTSEEMPTEKRKGTISLNGLKIEYGKPVGQGTQVGGIYIGRESRERKSAQVKDVVEPRGEMASVYIQISDLGVAVNKAEEESAANEEQEMNSRDALVGTRDGEVEISGQELAYATPSVGMPTNVINPQKVEKVATGGYEISHLGDVVMKAEREGVITLEDGELLVEAKRDVLIKAGKIDIEIRPEAVVVIKKKPSSVDVQVLWDKHDQSVEIRAKGEKIELSCAEEAIIGFEDISLADEFAADHIARRRVQGVKLGAEASGVRAEISLDEILQSNAILLSKFAKEGGKESELLKKLVKMAACVDEVLAPHGEYERL